MGDEVDETEMPVINIGVYDGPRNDIGEREGNGRSIYANKDVYVGDFKKGHRHGKGTYRWAYLGMQYKGDYVEGLRQGKGTMWYTNGIIYQGDWVAGKREGQGRMEFPNGDVYEGAFINGLPHGEGQYYYFSCDAMSKGIFQDGRIIKGTLTLKDGSIWDGEFRLNEPFGEGTWTSPAGWVQKGKYIEINPPPKEEGEAEEEKDEEEKQEEEKQEEEPPAEELDQDKPEKGEENGEDGQEGEKPDPREKTLKALLQPVKQRKAIDYFNRGVKQEKMRTLKLRWVPTGLAYLKE